MLNNVDELLAAAERDLPRLAQLKLSLEEKLSTLRRLDSEILDLTEEDALEDEIQQADEYNARVYSAMVRLKTTLESEPPPAVTPPTAPTRTVTPPERRMKLPKLTIQPFNGDLTLWTTFWDSYDSAIHQNASLTNIDKFNYLRSLLRGSAREALSGLTLSEANYTEAIAILKR